MVIYIDLLVLLNFSINFLLIYSAPKLMGRNIKIIRCFFAAAFGSVYAAFCTLMEFHVLGKPIFQILILATMCFIAYGIHTYTLQQSVLFYFLSMALAGIATGMNVRSFAGILFSGIALAALITVGFQGKNRRRQYVPVELHYSGNKKSFTAMVDSGNLLTDPISGDQVLVASPQIAMQMLGLSYEELRDPISAVTRLPHARLRLIPYRAVGQPGGMLLAAIFDKVIINGEEGSRTVAFSPYGFGDRAMFQALTGG